MKAKDMTDAEVDVLLERFDQTDPKLQRRIMVQFMLNAEQMRSERDKLQKFKDYVHTRLDAAGVPTDPDSPHKAEECRIGGRLDLVLADRALLHAIATPNSPAPAEVKAKLFRELMKRKEDGKPEGTREALARCVSMLDTYGPESYPANEHGQVHFVRAMMESVADTIRAFLDILPTEQEVKGGEG